MATTPFTRQHVPSIAVRQADAAADGRPSTVCPACGRSNPAGSRFCNACGAALTALTPETAHAYTPDHLARQILTSRSAIVGERKRVTVLFADVAGFTAISETLDAEDVHEIMDGCFKRLMDEIHRYEGTINQFTGDGVMALFGAPVAHEDHAQRACHAALAIQAAMQVYRTGIRDRYKIDFRMRIGLNSGPVVVGAIGDDLRMDYTAIGDTTNLSARMESLAQAGTICVSHNTYRLTQPYFHYTDLGRVQVKGKSDRQRIYRLTGARHPTSRLDAAARKGLSPFTGRKMEMSFLQGCFQRAADGRLQVVEIAGEPGAGKSRLIQELKHVINGNACWLESRCRPIGRTTALLPIRTMLGQYFAVSDADFPDAGNHHIGDRLHHLGLGDGQSLAAVQDMFGLPVADGSWHRMTPGQRKEKSYTTFCNIFSHLTDHQPLVLVIDDLHWIDKSSNEYISLLKRSLSGKPAMLILAFRPEYRQGKTGPAKVHRMSLNRLSADENANLIRSIIGRPPTKDLNRFIFHRTTGNPFFTEELTRTLMAEGAIDGAGTERIDHLSSVDTTVPDTIQGIIAARMDRLDDDLKHVLQVAAVMGRNFDAPVIEAVCGTRGRTDGLLNRLEDLEFIHCRPSPPAGRYRFQHVLTQQVAYDSLLRDERAACHEQIAVIVEREQAAPNGDTVEALAYHYEHSTNAAKACTYLVRSAEKALAGHFVWEAYEAFRRACRAMDRMPEDPQKNRRRLALLHRMIVPIIALGLPADSIAFLKEGLRLSRKLGDRQSMIRFCANSGVYYTNQLQPGKGLRYIQKAFQTAQQIADVDAIAQAGPDLCIVYMDTGAYDKAIATGQQITDAITKAGRQPEYFGGMTHIYSIITAIGGFCAGMLGNFDTALKTCEKALQSARHYGGPESVGMCEYNMGTVYLLKDNPQRAHDLLEKAVRHLEQARFFWHLPMSRSMLGMATLALGHPQAAIGLVRKSIQETLKAGIKWRLAGQLVHLGICRLALGDAQRSHRSLARGYRAAVTSGERHVAGNALVWQGRAEVAIDAGALNAATDKIRQGLKICQSIGALPDQARATYYLGTVLAQHHKDQEATARFRQAAALFGQMGMDRYRSKCLAAEAQIG